jgi:hypothetical protein
MWQKKHVAIGYKRGRLIWGPIMVKEGDKNILGHRLVDGWTRWVACAYNRYRLDRPKTAK